MRFRLTDWRFRSISFIIAAFLPLLANAQLFCIDQYNKAKRYYASGNYGRAIEQLKSCPERAQLRDNDLRAFEILECQTSLEYSKELFDRGKLREVTKLLEGCVPFSPNNRETRELKIEILALLAETYQFTDEHEKADEIYDKLLYLEPFYQPESISQEIKYLADKFETYPLTAYTIYGGVYMVTRPIITENFTKDGVTIVEEDYKRKNDDLRSWVAGLSADLSIDNSNVFISTGIALSSNYYRYNGTYANASVPSRPELAGSANLTFLERQRWFQIPLTLKWLIKPKEEIIQKTFIPYTFAGITFEILNKNSAQLQTPNITFANDLENPVVIEKFETGSRRTSFSPGILIGGGMKFHLRRFYVDFDVRYRLMLNNLTNTDERYSESIMLSEFNYVDNDFRIQNLGFTLGTGFFLFKSRKKTLN